MNTSVTFDRLPSEEVKTDDPDSQLWPSVRILGLVGHIERHVPNTLLVEEVGA